jgi:GH24 family phage-related lysozyme (muramidase)
MADPSKINSLTLFNGKKVSTEKIDERILEFLGLQDEYEISYDEYIGYLREAMVASRMSKSRYSTTETESITNEWKRVKSKKGRFKVKKITAASFKKGSAVGIQLGKQKLLKGISTKRLALPSALDNMSGANDINDIKNALSQIIANLTEQNKTQKKILERERIQDEKEKRAGAESLLEKGFTKALSAAQKMLAPIKSLLDKIIDAIVAIFIGRSIVKLIEWFANKDNQEKVKSIFKFLGEHWPKLLALYLRFGTGLGKFIGGLSSLLIRGTLRLVQAAAGLAARAGLRGAGKVSRFLGGTGGKLLGAGLEIGTAVAGTMALSKGIEDFGGFKFAGGGFANLKKLFGFSGGGAGSGYISGQKGVDKIPAMLSDGEFVMSRGAVQKYGTSTLEAMNAAGGGTNKPRMIGGTTYAAGGGFIGKVAHHLKQDEALSSLSKGSNDFIKPGGRSIISGKPWSALSPKTPLHSYVDSVGQPTIGWGSTYYDSILNGKKPVKMGDTITKEKADNILNANILNLSNTYSKKIPTWTKMTDDQKAGVLLVGYNAPYGPIGSYPKLTNSLKIGDMASAAANVQRGGPSASRISAEKKLLLSGPRDLSKSTSPKPKDQKPNILQQEGQKPNIFQQVGSGIASMFGLNQPAKAESVSRPKPRFAGGLAPDSSQRKSSSIPTMTFSASKSRASQRSISAPTNFMPEIVYEVASPTATRPSVGGGGSPQVPSFSNVHSSNNAIRNAKIYGVR